MRDSPINPRSRSKDRIQSGLVGRHVQVEHGRARGLEIAQLGGAPRGCDDVVAAREGFVRDGVAEAGGGAGYEEDGGEGGRGGGGGGGGGGHCSGEDGDVGWRVVGGVLGGVLVMVCYDGS